MSEPVNLDAAEKANVPDQSGGSTPWYRTRGGKIGLALGAVGVAALTIGLAVGIPVANANASSSADQNSGSQPPPPTPTPTSTSTQPPEPTPTSPPQPKPTLPAGPVGLISEVYFSPPDVVTRDNKNVCSKQFGGLGNTFIELHNPGNETVALGGCTVTSQKGVYYLFPATAAIGPSEYLLLRSNLYTGGNTTPYQFKGRLGAHGDTITVACGEQTLDQLVYSTTYPWDERAEAKGRSLERTTHTKFTNDPTAWRGSMTVGGTPGAANGARDPGFGYIASVATQPAAPTPRDAVKVTVQLRTPLAVQAASLQYEIAHSGMAPAALSMQVDGDTLVAQLPAQPAGSLVRYNVLVTYANNKTETLPNANDLAPVRSYYVYDSATAPTAGLNTIEMYGLTVPGGLAPPASRLFTPPQAVTAAVIRVGQDAPQVFDGADVYISGQKNIQIKFRNGQGFRGIGGLKIATEALTDPEWGRRLSAMIEYMGFHFMAQVPGVPAAYSDVFVIDTGMGAQKTVQAVIQMVDDYFLADKGLPTDGPLMKVSSNDKKIIDTCYVAEDDAPAPGSDGYYNDTSIAARLYGATTFDALNDVIDVERFAGYIAGSVMCANWDGFGQNHFLSFTSTPAGRFAVVPWDLDHTWGYPDSMTTAPFNANFPFTYPAGNPNTYQPALGTSAVFEQLLGQYKEFRTRVLDIVRDALVTRKLFDAENMPAFVDATAARMTAMVNAASQTGAAAAIAECATKTKAFIAQQKAFLLAEIEKGTNAFGLLFATAV